METEEREKASNFVIIADSDGSCGSSKVVLLVHKTFLICKTHFMLMTS